MRLRLSPQSNGLNLSDIDAAKVASMRLRLSPQSNGAVDHVLHELNVASMRLRLSPQSNSKLSADDSDATVSFNEAAAFHRRATNYARGSIELYPAASMRLRLSPQSNNGRR